MALASLHPQSLELFCELSGKVPDFNLTLGFGDNKSRITEGNWTLKVTNEQGNASISFVLCNTTAEDKSQGTGYVSPVSPNALIITWCLLCVGIFIVSFSSVSVIYIIKLRRRGRRRRLHVTETEANTNNGAEEDVEFDATYNDTREEEYKTKCYPVLETKVGSSQKKTFLRLKDSCKKQARYNLSRNVFGGCLAQNMKATTTSTQLRKILESTFILMMVAKIEDSVNIFTVEVETENNPGYDEYRCLPNVIFPRHEVKSCSAKMETETQSSSVPGHIRRREIEDTDDLLLFKPLLDCAWIHSQLHCIKQKDIEYKHPVSTLAEITIPRSFADRNGSYSCGGQLHNISLSELHGSSAPALAAVLSSVDFLTFALNSQDLIGELRESVPVDLVLLVGTQKQAAICNLGLEHGKPSQVDERKDEIQNNQFNGPIHENPPNDKGSGKSKITNITEVCYRLSTDRNGENDPLVDHELSRSREEESTDL
ncbi:hypothetical protein C0Q70_12457 [Pomacea canaliculata]|uniref:Uncharacterized protein n=1 Tax=Pomacea canaliculata TaxID=400727 RepID=A0A2T7P1K1_POMCA|nr:hypothetical protein C0Q70_12457 [Pomacea canaliculata]